MSLGRTQVSRKAYLTLEEKRLRKNADRRAKIRTRDFEEWRVVIILDGIPFQTECTTKERATATVRRLRIDLADVSPLLKVSLDYMAARQLTDKGF